jgi:hypothetical protein
MKNPKEIAWTIEAGPLKGQTGLGIYELDGDTYKVCYAVPGKPRPREFASRPDTGISLEVYKRTEDTPELQVLNHWIGEWDVDTTFKPNNDFPKGARIKGVATATWIPNGRCLQQTGTREPGDGLPGMKYTTLMTYDPGEKVYRTWFFLSTGFVSESVGTWEERSSGAPGDVDPAFSATSCRHITSVDCHLASSSRPSKRNGHTARSSSSRMIVSAPGSSGSASKSPRRRRQEA